MVHENTWFDYEEFLNWGIWNCVIVKGKGICLKIWLWGIFENLSFRPLLKRLFGFWTQFWKFCYFRKLWASGHNKVQKTFLFMIDFGLSSLKFENYISLEKGSWNFKTNLQRNILFGNVYIIEKGLWALNPRFCFLFFCENFSVLEFSI